MAKPTIMCIDDDPNVVSAIHRLLFVSGYEVVSTSIEMAFEDLIEISRPDLILLDLTMPRVSGLSILEWIRSHPQLGETPVFIVSGRSESELISKALTLGATRFIPKPFEPESLVEAIRKELHEKKAIA